jgi:hypothetical protein
MAKKTVQGESEQVFGVVIDVSDGDHKNHAVEFVPHRGYDKLLCNHVYFGFCQVCPLYECDRRNIPPILEVFCRMKQVYCLKNPSRCKYCEW